MASILDIKQDIVIKKVAEELKKFKELEMPEWAKFVKTSVARERPPTDLDWWYFRAASILRKLAVKGNIGVNRLKKEYGGRRDRGHKPFRMYHGSGKIIRVILQQLEKIGFVEKLEKNKKINGRVLSAKGKSFLNKLIKTK